MKVWIEQEYCTGAGLCEAIEPEMFVLGDEGLAVLRTGGTVLPPGRSGTLDVLPEKERDVREASQACPGRCIHVESD